MDKIEKQNPIITYKTNLGTLELGHQFVHHHHQGHIHLQPQHEIGQDDEYRF
jgi:hypothetical protein